MTVAAGIRAGLRQAIHDAALRVQAAGDLPAVAVPTFEVEPPRHRSHGDLATNAAMVLAQPARANPRKIAEVLVRHLALPADRVTRTEIAGPGFINFFIAPDWFHASMQEVIRAGGAYGQCDVGRGRRVLVEFVSANPTGPLHVGTGRNAAVGEAVARLLEKLDYAVSREYYVNDCGTQVDALGRSVEWHYFQHFGRPLPFPEDGYRGQYVADIAARIVAGDGPRWVEAPAEARQAHFQDFAVRAILEDIQGTLRDFGVPFDRWFGERTLHESGKVAEVIARLRDLGHVYDQDRAVWFRSTAFGDDKDRVLVRSTGQPTYFAADVPYHVDKFERGFDHLIDVWGVDHQGDIARVKGGLQALGYDSSRLEILIHQHVRLREGGEIVRMSKRTGEFVTLRELLEAVGRDAARYFFLMTHYANPMDFDLDLAVRSSQENPVYYVQYAHARIASILREAAGHPVGQQLVREGRIDQARVAAVGLSALTHEAELALMARVDDLPEVILKAGLRREPHRVCTYAQDLAEAFHVFYTQCRVLGEDAGLTAARLVLLEAARTALRVALGLAGVAAPERM
ncbi:MAG: arginine--tRNA ligase [Armatimonadetes bacterium]|nr:arginine--tRNA ligase [Armatimonadota bacterium]